jgi:hypothetical protein
MSIKNTGKKVAVLINHDPRALPPSLKNQTVVPEYEALLRV